MRTLVVALGVLCSIGAGPSALAQPSVFFEETFTGPTLDSSVWHTEILTAGRRWCAVTSAPWEPGTWIEEGTECHGVVALSPYGSAPLSGGLLSMSSSNGRAFPYLVSRLPGSTPLFPAAGDFSLRVRMRYDRLTPWGDGLIVFQTESTDPSGTNQVPNADQVVLQLWEGNVYTTLDGSWHQVAAMPTPTAFHEFVLACVGGSYTITADGALLYGPVTSAMRPTALYLGNPCHAFWYPTDWSSFTVDYIRVELPGPPDGACCFSGFCLQGTETACLGAGGRYLGDGTSCDPHACGPTSVDATTWGRVKANYRQ